MMKHGHLTGYAWPGNIRVKNIIEAFTECKQHDPHPIFDRDQRAPPQSTITKVNTLEPCDSTAHQTYRKYPLTEKPGPGKS
jgi:transcriptional regulator with PAS, ATPase and Fis domain